MSPTVRGPHPPYELSDQLIVLRIADRSDLLEYVRIGEVPLIAAVQALHAEHRRHVELTLTRVHECLTPILNVCTDVNLVLDR